MQYISAQQASPDWRKRQRGATALEFAFVFPILFMLFYATLHFGLLFTARLSLQHAAEEGAREALRWVAPQAENGNGGNDGEESPCALGSLQTGLSEGLTRRLERSLELSCTQTNWLARFAEPIVSIRICDASDAACADDTGTDPPECGGDDAEECQVIVTIRYPYGTAGGGSGIIPALPGFGILAPDALQGRARVLLDRRLL